MKNWELIEKKIKSGELSFDEAALGLDPSKYKKLPTTHQKFGTGTASASNEVSTNSVLPFDKAYAGEEESPEVVPLEDLKNQYLQMLGGSAMDRADAYRMEKALPKPNYDKLEKGIITDEEVERMYQGY